MTIQKGGKMPKLPKPSSRNPVPAGTYKVRLVNYEHGHSSKKGTPQITWKAEIIDPEDFSGQNLWDRTIMIENCLWRVANLLAACSLDFPDDVDTDSMFFNTICQTALGRTSYWQVTEKMLDTGTMVNEVKDYRSDEDQELLEVSSEEEAPDWLEK